MGDSKNLYASANRSGNRERPMLAIAESALTPRAGFLENSKPKASDRIGQETAAETESMAETEPPNTDPKLFL